MLEMECDMYVVSNKDVAIEWEVMGKIFDLLRMGQTKQQSSSCATIKNNTPKRPLAAILNVIF